MFYRAKMTFTHSGVAASAGDLIETDKQVPESLAAPLEVKFDEGGVILGYFDGDVMHFDAKRRSTARAMPGALPADDMDGMRAELQALRDELEAIKQQSPVANKAEKTPANKAAG